MDITSKTMNWTINATYVAEVCGGYVNWDEEYYICPECDEPVYADDWQDGEFADFLCPICECTINDID